MGWVSEVVAKRPYPLRKVVSLNGFRLLYLRPNICYNGYLMGGYRMTTLQADGFQGWTNRETWNVQLWITNQEPLYKLVRILLGNRNIGSVTTGTFADDLEAFLWIMWEGMTPDGCKLNPVNWVEIATTWFSDNKEYLDELDGLQTL